MEPVFTVQHGHEPLVVPPAAHYGPGHMDGQGRRGWRVGAGGGGRPGVALLLFLGVTVGFASRAPQRARPRVRDRHLLPLRRARVLRRQALAAAARPGRRHGGRAAACQDRRLVHLGGAGHHGHVARRRRDARADAEAGRVGGLRRGPRARALLPFPPQRRRALRRRGARLWPSRRRPRRPIPGGEGLVNLVSARMYCNCNTMDYANLAILYGNQPERRWSGSVPFVPSFRNPALVAAAMVSGGAAMEALVALLAMGRLVQLPLAGGSLALGYTSPRRRLGEVPRRPSPQAGGDGPKALAASLFGRPEGPGTCSCPLGLSLGWSSRRWRRRPRWSSRMPVPPDAIELSVAASEAMVIAEMILDDPHSSKLAAVHVKEACKEFYSDVIQDVGQSLIVQFHLNINGNGKCAFCVMNFCVKPEQKVIQDVGLSLESAVMAMANVHYV